MGLVVSSTLSVAFGGSDVRWVGSDFVLCFDPMLRYHVSDLNRGVPVEFVCGQKAPVATLVGPSSLSFSTACFRKGV